LPVNDEHVGHPPSIYQIFLFLEFFRISSSYLIFSELIFSIFKEGNQTPEIARKTDHTEEACDRYIKAYKKVEMLNKTMKSEEIANVLGMGKSLVDEYIRILNEE
jgi:hypothetical protein